MSFPRLVRTASGSLPERSDDELMALAQAGVREAFAVLVERHAARLVHACSALVHDSGAGAELAQETWVTVWAQRSRYRPEGRFVVWLITAARNRCRKYVPGATASSGGTRSRPPPRAPSRRPTRIDRLLLEERRRRVLDALSRLPERMREALVLRYAEDLRYDEMAEVLRTGESTLRSRVHHGLRLLRNILEKNR